MTDAGSRARFGDGTLAANPWWILSLAVLSQVGFSLIEMGVPLVAGYMKEDLGLSAAAAGIVVSAHFLGKTVGSYPAGVVVDRIGEKRILLAGAALVGATLILSTAVPFPWVLLPLALAGVFSAVSVPAGGSLIRHIFPARRRGLALSIRQSGIPLGGLVAAVLLPPVAHVYGWRGAIGVVGVLTFLAALPLLLTHAPAHAGIARSPAGSGARRGAGRRITWLTPDVRRLTMYSSILVTGQFALLIFLPLDLHERRHLPLAAGAAFVALIQVAGMVGRLSWAAVSDRLLPRGRRPVLVVLTLACIGAAVFLALVPGDAPLGVWVAAALLAGLSLNSFQGLWITMLTEAADLRSVGRATGFAVTFNLIAVVISAPLFGAIADHAGTYRAVWLVLSLLLAVALLPIVRVGRPDTVDAGAGYGQRMDQTAGSEGAVP